MQSFLLTRLPAREVEQLRKERVSVTAGETVGSPGRLFDAVVSCRGTKSIELEVREGVVVCFANGMLTLDMGDEGYGRDKRSVELDELYCLRVLSDATMLEVFVNDGEVALTGRTYSSAAPAMQLRAEGDASMEFYRLAR